MKKYLINALTRLIKQNKPTFFLTFQKNFSEALRKSGNPVQLKCEFINTFIKQGEKWHLDNCTKDLIAKVFRGYAELPPSKRSPGLIKFAESEILRATADPYLNTLLIALKLRTSANLSRKCLLKIKDNTLQVAEDHRDYFTRVLAYFDLAILYNERLLESENQQKGLKYAQHGLEVWRKNEPPSRIKESGMILIAEILKSKKSLTKLLTMHKEAMTQFPLPRSLLSTIGKNMINIRISEKKSKNSTETGPVSASNPSTQITEISGESSLSARISLEQKIRSSGMDLMTFIELMTLSKFEMVLTLCNFLKAPSVNKFSPLIEKLTNNFFFIDSGPGNTKAIHALCGGYIGRYLESICQPQKNKPGKCLDYFIKVTESDNGPLQQLAYAQLAEIFLKGTTTIDQNPEKASLYLQEIAKENYNCRAQYAYALTLINNQYRDKKGKSSYQYLARSAASNHLPAYQKLDEFMKTGQFSEIASQPCDTLLICDGYMDKMLEFMCEHSISDENITTWLNKKYGEPNEAMISDFPFLNKFLLALQKKRPPQTSPKLVKENVSIPEFFMKFSHTGSKNQVEIILTHSPVDFSDIAEAFTALTHYPDITSTEKLTIIEDKKSIRWTFAESTFMETFYKCLQTYQKDGLMLTVPHDELWIQFTMSSDHLLTHEKLQKLIFSILQTAKELHKSHWPTHTKDSPELSDSELPYKISAPISKKSVTVEKDGNNIEKNIHLEQQRRAQKVARDLTRHSPFPKKGIPVGNSNSKSQQSLEHAKSGQDIEHSSLPPLDLQTNPGPLASALSVSNDDPSRSSHSTESVSIVHRSTETAAPLYRSKHQIIFFKDANPVQAAKLRWLNEHLTALSKVAFVNPGDKKSVYELCYYHNFRAVELLLSCFSDDSQSHFLDKTQLDALRLTLKYDFLNPNPSGMSQLSQELVTHITKPIKYASENKILPTILKPIKLNITSFTILSDTPEYPINVYLEKFIEAATNFINLVTDEGSIPPEDLDIAKIYLMIMGTCFEPFKAFSQTRKIFSHPACEVVEKSIRLSRNFIAHDNTNLNLNHEDISEEEIVGLLEAVSMLHQQAKTILKELNPDIEPADIPQARI